MSQVKLEAPFSSFRGKICKHSDVIFKQMYGTQFTTKICNPYTGEATEAQVAARNKFAQTLNAIKALDEEAMTQYREAFKKQKKYKTLRGFLFAKLYKETV